ncbi:MAG: prolyl oligopeptidase family serine peptidase [Bacteroidetes bacterium]|jgi:dipeptidyl-peptidase 4|nr:prolyl oligopeptidase family serine peptidase [Bacteroidota bacterium]MBT3749898.1 prolyl oligopeptidase family serine peptidase [Bacteroidota bacterium]MBT4398258.1 prolyl oligopeptidase family serine peptidase [Bacteroidota bacterium]MBT4409043.1 prolyl oligopeptidase family serine peptidase [Bacteroidota bacterium]MBT5425526.1 prolyl oligopeptidase family serine peptidase [Bacteroidota bacterium]
MKKLTSLIFLFVSLSTLAQSPYSPKVLSTKDYAKAELSMRNHTNPLVVNGSIRPVWIDNEQFWYTRSGEDGNERILVNAKKRTKTSMPSDDTNTSGNMPRYRRGGSTSPDGTKMAFIRDYNLWLKDINTDQETQLTTDGIKDFGYATNNAGWTKSSSPVLLWSPDSKKIATFQHDGRGVGDMYLVTTNVGHPKLESWKYPLPEDSVIFRIHRVIIHVNQSKIVRLKMNPDQHRSSITDHIASGGKLADAEWSKDGTQLMFLSNSRDHKVATLRVANATTGEVRTVLEEKVDTFYESGYSSINWRFLPETNEFIWFSQKSNWGHLYLYDLASGKLKNAITGGHWNATEILRMDLDKRAIYITGLGREPGDPYFQYFYSINMDGSNLRLLSPDSANHSISLSPDGKYFVDTYSTPQIPPVYVLRNIKNNKSLELERADISKLLATGWEPPVSFSTKARDGKTDCYGMLFKPKNLDPNKKYPIINSIYPGPQSGSVGSRSFSASRGDRQAMAELGFIVITLDAMGTPKRSKSFHEAYYGNMGDNGLPDQISGMKQLAKRYPWIDLDRVGIYGHSGGGFASTDAILRYPDFFDVAVSGAGNHDNRNYEDDWGEKWQGLLETYPDGKTNYDNQANQLLAKNLKGKLLLAHGTMDGNVPYYNTLLVVNELIAANKDFDLILFPNRGHGFGGETYMIRRKWDYFVRHLLGAEPPVEYEFGK